MRSSTFRHIAISVRHRIVRFVPMRHGAAILSLLLVAIPAQAQMMALPGQFDVSPSGGAMYTVPIEVPPGTAGMVPQLTLSYSSQSVDGLVGMGWSLAGLPAITRCPQTIAQDSAPVGVSFTATDRFCLDGQRLLAISGTYGANATEYRTEIDGFSRIISYGATGTGPAWFRVWTKSGQIMDFGNTSDSAPLAVGKSSVRVWAVNKIADTAGNYLTVTYSNNTTTGESRPIEIDYTGNSTASVAPYNAVKFTYGTRTTLLTSYQAGSPVTTSGLLSAIQTYANGNIVSNYQFAYQAGSEANGSVTARDRLTSITRCADLLAKNCLPATTFAWQNGGTLSASSPSTPNTPAGTSVSVTGYHPYAGNFFGNGRADILWVPLNSAGGATVGKVILWKSNGNGSFTASTTSFSTPAPLASGATFKPILTDLNGDGLTDIYWSATIGTSPAGDGTNQVWLNSGNGSFSIGLTSNGSFASPMEPLVADFSGDGLPDILWVSTDNTGLTIVPKATGLMASPTVPAFVYWVGNGSGGFATKSTTMAIGVGYRAYVADFNGDGQADVFWDQESTFTSASGNNNLYSYGASKGSGFTSLNQGNGNFTAVSASAAGDSNGINGYKPYIGNFGTDGNAGILWDHVATDGRSDGSDRKIWLGNGDGTFRQGNKIGNPNVYNGDNVGNENGFSAQSRIYIADFQGLGRSDILFNIENSDGTSAGAVHIYLNNGDGTFRWHDNLTTPNQSGTGYHPFLADFSGHGKAEILWDLENSTGISQNAQILWSSDGLPTDAMTSFTTGLAMGSTINYATLSSLTSSGIYTPASGDAYPTADVNGALWVISGYSASNGIIGGTYGATYQYGGAKANLAGRGFLGFQSVTAIDPQTGRQRKTQYNQIFPLTGLPSQTDDVIAGTTLNETVIGYDQVAIPTTGFTRYFVAPNSNAVKISNDIDFSGSSPVAYALPTSTTATTYDCDIAGPCYGNALSITTTTKSTTIPSVSYSTTTTNSYYGAVTDATHWLLGRLETASVQKKAPGSSLTRTSGFNYDLTSTSQHSATGLLTAEIIEPASAAPFKIETDYAYDSFGNRISTTVTPSDTSATARTTTTSYDSLGQFATSVTNALGQTSSFLHDARFGGVTQATDPNDVITSASYDGFGRKATDTMPDMSVTSHSYTLSSATCITGSFICSPNEISPLVAGYVVVDVTMGQDGKTQVAPTRTSLYDALGRIGMQVTQLEDGTGSFVQTTYDSLGRISTVSRPYRPPGDTPQLTSMSYDLLGRIIQIKAADGGTGMHRYQGLSTIDSNPDSETLTTTRNAIGQVASVTDTLGNTTAYGYDSYGDLILVTDVAGNTTSYSFDQRGRKTGMTDPDMGSWSYTYDSLGQLTSQTDAKAQKTNYSYDLLGRMTQRAEPDLTSNWVYDTQTYGIGKLASATTTQGYSRSRNYDSLGRPTALLVAIPNGSLYSSGITYDTNGRVSSITEGGSGEQLLYSYSATGVASVLKLATPAYGNQAAQTVTLASIGSVDASSHVTGLTYGNTANVQRGYTATNGRLATITTSLGSTPVQNLSYGYDSLGNVTSRNDIVNKVNESFSYDPLNRLTAVSGPAPKSFGYDKTGNITTKSDIGAYSYSTTHPHQISTVAGSPPGSFTYDANGNLTGDATGRVLTWTSFNMPKTISSGGKTISFTYDTEHRRISQTTPEGTTFYPWLDGFQTEQFVGTGGAATQTQYLSFAGQMVAANSVTTSTAKTTSAVLNYIHTDALGSVVALSSGGAVKETDSFDAWGQRRLVTGADGTPAVASQLTHAYDGQESLSDVGLVHMNGRVYDPRLGRFISADPTTEAPLNGQDWNRYAYVGNNPLTYGDPNGMCFLGCFWKPVFKSPVFKAVVAIAIAYTGQVYALPALEGVEVAEGSTLAAAEGPTLLAVNAGISGAAAGAASTGTWKGAALGAFSAELFTGVGGLKTDWGLNGSDFGSVAGSAALHGAAGGIVSVAGGGSFGSGFVAAGFADAAGSQLQTDSDIANLAIHTVTGGIGSVLGGGKFENGAITGAFGYLFNDLAHAWAGTQATYALADQLNFRDGGGWMVNRGAFWDILLDGNADLINADGETFEVKTNNCLSNAACNAAAAAQLNRYIESSDGKLTVGSEFTAFAGAPSITGFGRVWTADVQYWFVPNATPGLIGYDIENERSALSSIWSAYGQRKSGAGGVVPPPPIFAVP